MRRAKIVVVAILTISLAGCVLSGKPKTAAAPPAAPKPAATSAPPAEPLSIPQTKVDLPAPQPVVPEALVTAPVVNSNPTAPAKPAETTPPKPATNTRPAGPKAPDTLPAAEPETPVRTPIQEILTPDQQKDYRTRAQKYQKDTRGVLSTARLHTPEQKRQEQEINNFLKQSEQAENSGDLRLAVQLAERAFTLAKELQSGK